jgi:hypothetical protein
VIGDGGLEVDTGTKTQFRSFWQRMEKEAQADIETGLVTEHDSIEDLIKDLDALEDAEDQD